jgi:hypothetical protein
LTADHAEYADSLRVFCAVRGYRSGRSDVRHYHDHDARNLARKRTRGDRLVPSVQGLMGAIAWEPRLPSMVCVGVGGGLDSNVLHLGSLRVGGDETPTCDTEPLLAVDMVAIAFVAHAPDSRTRCTERRPRNAIGQSESLEGAAVGELIVQGRADIPV